MLTEKETRMTKDLFFFPFVLLCLQNILHMFVINMCYVWLMAGDQTVKSLKEIIFPRWEESSLAHPNIEQLALFDLIVCLFVEYKMISVGLYISQRASLFLVLFTNTVKCIFVILKTKIKVPETVGTVSNLERI